MTAAVADRLVGLGVRVRWRPRGFQQWHGRTVLLAWHGQPAVRPLVGPLAGYDTEAAVFTDGARACGWQGNLLLAHDADGLQSSLLLAPHFGAAKSPGGWRTAAQAKAAVTLLLLHGDLAGIAWCVDWLRGGRWASAAEMADALQPPLSRRPPLS